MREKKEGRRGSVRKSGVKDAKAFIFISGICLKVTLQK